MLTPALPRHAPTTITRVEIQSENHCPLSLTFLMCAEVSSAMAMIRSASPGRTSSYPAIICGGGRGPWYVWDRRVTNVRCSATTSPASASGADCGWSSDESGTGRGDGSSVFVTCLDLSRRRFPLATLDLRDGILEHVSGRLPCFGDQRFTGGRPWPNLHHRAQVPRQVMASASGPSLSRRGQFSCSFAFCGRVPRLHPHTQAAWSRSKSKVYARCAFGGNGLGGDGRGGVTNYGGALPLPMPCQLPTAQPQQEICFHDA